MKITLDIPDDQYEAVLDAFADPDDRSVEVVERKLMQVLASAVIVKARAKASADVEAAFGVSIPQRVTGRERIEQRRPGS